MLTLLESVILAKRFESPSPGVTICDQLYLQLNRLNNTEVEIVESQLTLEDDHRVPHEVQEAKPAALTEAALQEVHHAGRANL